MNHKLAFVISCLFVSACALTANFAPTRSSFVPSSTTRAEDVEVYRTEKPTRPYEEIGTVYVGSTNLENAINAMKIEAAKNGGNAILHIKVTSDGIVGTVVRYK
jgi:hypothetical protein